MRDFTLVEKAVEEWKATEAAESGRLSDAARARILNTVLFEPRPSESPLAALFPAMGRLVLAATLPAVILAVALGYWSFQAPSLVTGGTRLTADKLGDEVVFMIANGQRTHNVYRSSSPDRLGEQKPFRTADGSFRDDLHSDSNLVYYRID